MKRDKRSWLLDQVSQMSIFTSWLLLHPTALSRGAGEDLGILIVPKYDNTESCIGIFIGVKAFWSCPRYLSCSLLLLLKTAESFCPCPAQLALTQSSSMSVCPSSRPSHPWWFWAPLCVPMATAQHLCSSLGNFPLSRPPLCNKLSQSGFPAQPLVGVGTVAVFPTAGSQCRGWGSPVWGSARPHRERIAFPSGSAKSTTRSCMSPQSTNCHTGLSLFSKRGMLDIPDVVLPNCQ